MAIEIDLREKTAIVTGGTRGIGRATVIALGAAGANVVINATESSEPQGLELVERLKAFGVEGLFVPGDIAKAETSKDIIEKAQDKFGRLDILVCNAGIKEDNLLLRMKEEQWTRVLDVNLNGSRYIAQAALRLMLKQEDASMVFISSASAHGVPGQSNYAASKGAIESFAKTLAVEYASRGLRVNAVAPGPVDTDMLNSLKDEQRSALIGMVPLGRAISAVEVAKLAGSLYKPNGLVVIEDEEAAQFILDRIELNEICGIGFRIKKRLNNMGINNFKDLRKVPLKALLASFKSYGQTLYNMSRGIDNSVVVPFYEKEEVKSIGHRHTIDHDTNNPEEIKQILLKLTELIARKLRTKKLVGKTVSFWLRNSDFSGEGMQTTISSTQDGLEIFKAGWKIFHQIWSGEKIRMIGVSISNLKPLAPQNLTFLQENLRQEKITRAIDQVNNKYGEFTLQRGILLGSSKMRRMPNPF